MTIEEAVMVLKRENAWRWTGLVGEGVNPPTYYEYREALTVLLAWYDTMRDDLK